MKSLSTGWKIIIVAFLVYFVTGFLATYYLVGRECNYSGGVECRYIGVFNAIKDPEFLIVMPFWPFAIGLTLLRF